MLCLKGAPGSQFIPSHRRFPLCHLHGQKFLPELGHSCSALAMRVLAMFFSPARYSSRTDSNLGKQTRGWDMPIYHSMTNYFKWPSARETLLKGFYVFTLLLLSCILSRILFHTHVEVRGPLLETASNSGFHELNSDC